MDNGIKLKSSVYKYLNITFIYQRFFFKIHLLDDCKDLENREFSKQESLALKGIVILR